MILTIYVPKPRTYPGNLIDPASGVVGDPRPLLDEPDPYTRVRIYFEGNRYGAMNIKTYADRLDIAAGRCAVRYPTIAQMRADKADLIEIGEWDPVTRSAAISDWRTLETWLGVKPIPPGEIAISALANWYR